MSKSQILFAFLRQYLYTPAYLIGLETLGDVHRHIGRDDDVPVLVMTIFDEEDAYNLLAHETVHNEVPAVVLWHFLCLCALIARNHLIHVLMESPDTIPFIVHFTHTKKMQAPVTYRSYGMDKLFVGEPAVAKGVCGTKHGIPSTLHHAYGAICLFHVKFLETCVVRVLLVAFLGELSLALFLAQPVVLLCSLLAVQGEVNGYRSTTVEVGEYQLLEAQNALVLHVVKHAVYTFYRNTGLLQCRVIDDIAAGLTVLLGMLLAKKGEETDAHAEQQSAPVHRLTVHHAVVAVLASVNQRIEVLAVHAKYARTVEAEQAQRDYQLQGGYALLLLQTKPAKGQGKPKTTEYRHNIVVNSLFFVQKLVHLMNIF